MNLENVKLVCLMPTYNKQDTLAKAIESVMMQKADFAYKLVILDDCSSDDSYAIAQDYKKCYPDKIEIVRNETNLKLLKSITNGYSLLKGVDYFCVLDADDYYIYDKKFADAVAFLESHKNYTIYMANMNVLTDEAESPLIKKCNKTIDFDWNDYKKGKGIFVQTSGAIFRNVYFKDEVDKKFLHHTKEKYGEALRADGFRVPYHLNAGKSHFVDNIESVYNYMGGGKSLYSSLKHYEQDLGNSHLMFALAQFFPQDKDFFLKQTKIIYDTAIEGFRGSDKKYIEKNKDLIFYLYSNTYLTDNPIFDNPLLKLTAKNSLIENIFSVRNSIDKRHKIITILGLKFKFKRKAK